MQAGTLIRKLKFISKDWWGQQDKIKIGVFLVAIFVLSIITFEGYWTQIVFFFTLTYMSEKISAWYIKTSKYLAKKKMAKEKELKSRNIH